MPYKRGTKWVAQIRKREARLEKVFQTKKDAMDWESQMRKQPAEDWKRKTSTTCLGDWAQKYLDYAKAKFSAKTYDEKRAMFRRFFKHVEPAMPVAGLKPSAVLDYVMGQKKLRSGYSANKDRKNLISAWNWGAKYFEPPLPRLNPCLVEKMPEVRQPRYVPPEVDFWKVYEAVEGQDRVMLLTFLHLGARRGEVFKLTWEDIDWPNSRIRLWTKKRLDGTNEYDWLPMTQELRKAMMWWWENRPIKDKANVFICLDKTAFCQEFYGEPFQVRRHFMARLCDRVGVKPFGFHAIRHLTASTLFRLGCEVGVIQIVLRHRSPSTTERYLRSIGLERVREALENLAGERGAEIVPFDLENRRQGGEKT